MKKLLTLAFLFVLAMPVFAQEAESQEEANGPRIKFSESLHDFGDIHQGDKVQYVFSFENTGTEPLVLTNVETTCGCTASNWPRDPIAPGETGEMTVTFNSTGKMGLQNKNIRVRSNAVNNVETVKIVTNVLPKQEEG
ncbi:DUF1573 domain-containing protein [Roseivirga sp. BDSF3-8]|uniref:DUF1573 domain-containing protein n=1 Tax=Roseivirga sp. BDSF3-8 TaxID=3241598 RepID=UPI00353182B4